MDNDTPGTVAYSQVSDPASFEPQPDSGVIDAATPLSDAATPLSDAATPLSDAATPPEGIVQELEHIEQVVVAEAVAVVHTIERRCFGRATADDPVVVTKHTGN